MAKFRVLEDSVSWDEPPAASLALSTRNTAPSIYPHRLVDQDPIFLHLLVERGAMNIQDLGGLLAIPVEGLERPDDEALLRLRQGLLEGPDAHRQMGNSATRPGAKPGTLSRLACRHADVSPDGVALFDIVPTFTDLLRQSVLPLRAIWHNTDFACSRGAPDNDR